MILLPIADPHNTPQCHRVTFWHWSRHTRAGVIPWLPFLLLLLPSYERARICVPRQAGDYSG